MNKKDTQYICPTFDKMLGQSMRDLFHPKSKSCLYDAKQLALVNTSELNLINKKELDLVKWKDLNLVDMKLLVAGFQYIGAVSFLAFFLSSLALSVVMDERTYRTNLTHSRAEQKFALEKAQSKHLFDQFAAVEVTQQTRDSELLATGYVLGMQDEIGVEEVVVETTNPYESESSNSFYREGLCSFSANGTLYSSGSMIQPSNNLKVCVKSVGDENQLEASLISDSNGEDRNLNMTNNCFTASRALSDSVVSVSLVGADKVRIGGCNLLVSAL